MLQDTWLLHRQSCCESLSGKGCQDPCSINRTREGNLRWAGMAQPCFLLRVPPSSSGFTQAGSETKMISMFCLIITNCLQKHWEKEQVHWVLGIPATGCAPRAWSTTLQWQCCSLTIPCAATCPFPGSQVVTENEKSIVAGRQGARLPADGLTPSPMALRNAHSAQE